MPSSTTRCASAIIAKYTRFATKPHAIGLSFTTIGFLPHARATSVTVAIVSSLVVGVTTISASFITGAGDAQCQPITRSGRSVAAASAAIGNPDVFDARIVVGRRGAVEIAEHLDLQVEPFGHRLDRRGRLPRPSSNVGGERDADERGVGFGTRQLSPARPRVEPEAPVVTCCRPCVDAVGCDVVADGLVAGDRGHLRDPAAHHARAEHSDAHATPQSEVGARCGRARGRALRARAGSAPSARPPTAG